MSYPTSLLRSHPHCSHCIVVDISHSWAKRTSTTNSPSSMFCTRTSLPTFPCCDLRSFDESLSCIPSSPSSVASSLVSDALTDAVQWQYTGASAYFKTDRLRRVFTFASMYMGMSPFDAPRTYVSLCHRSAVQRTNPHLAVSPRLLGTTRGDLVSNRRIPLCHRSPRPHRREERSQLSIIDSRLSSSYRSEESQARYWCTPRIGGGAQGRRRRV